MVGYVLVKNRVFLLEAREVLHSVTSVGYHPLLY